MGTDKYQNLSAVIRGIRDNFTPWLSVSVRVGP